jgi:hypothetical protein
MHFNSAVASILDVQEEVSSKDPLFWARSPEYDAKLALAKYDD